MPLEYLFFHKNKLIEIASVAKGLERDAISVFKTKEERHGVKQTMYIERTSRGDITRCSIVVW